MAYNSAIKNEISPFVTMCMDTEGIVFPQPQGNKRKVTANISTGTSLWFVERCVSIDLRLEVVAVGNGR